jgi:hypothetical protein
LTWGPFNEAVVIKQLKPPQHLLLAAAKKRREMIGAQESVAVNVFQNFPVAVGQTESRDIL